MKRALLLFLAAHPAPSRKKRERHLSDHWCRGRRCSGGFDKAQVLYWVPVFGHNHE